MPQTLYRKGTKQDLAQIIDFGNYVFSHSHSATDFPSLLPKLYGANADTAQIHYLALQDGRIVGMIGAFDVPLLFGEKELLARGIGTVSVHPYHRGEGHMKKLMSMALQDMEKDGVALSFLGGQRQRYGYFGYESCGTQLRFTVTKTNLRHLYPDRFAQHVQLLEMNENTPGQILLQMQALYEAQPLHALRGGNFLAVCRSWSCVPYLLYQQDKLLGYACVGDSPELPELCLYDPQTLPAALDGILCGKNYNSLCVHAAPIETARITQLQEICEDYEIAAKEMYNILDFAAVCGALLQVKNAACPLLAGRLTLDIAGYGALTLACKDGKVSAGVGTEQPDICLSRSAAMRFLFSPMQYYADFGTVSPAAKSWLPLPLGLSQQDGV